MYFMVTQIINGTTEQSPVGCISIQHFCHFQWIVKLSVTATTVFGCLSLTNLHIVRFKLLTNLWKNNSTIVRAVADHLWSFKCCHRVSTILRRRMWTIFSNTINILWCEPFHSSSALMVRVVVLSGAVILSLFKSFADWAGYLKRLPCIWLYPSFHHI